MNVKKYLKKKAQEDLQSLQTEHDQEALQLLKDSVAEKAPQKKRNLKWLWAIPSGALACAVAAVLIVELVPFPNKDGGGVVPPPPSIDSGDAGSDSGEIRYDEINFVQENSDLTELSNALTNLTLHFTENQSVDVAKTSDSLSGDELYYVLTIDENSMEAMYNMQFLIVVNDHYDYKDFEVNEDFVTETYADYSITYLKKITPDSGLNMITGSAKIESSKYEMYVLSYEEYSLENGMLLTVVNRMLEFHE